MSEEIIDLFNPDTKSDAFDFLIKEYFKPGFGTLNKSDIDLIFFSAFLTHSVHSQASDYDLSKILQITQPRIRNLRIKNGLKYEKFDPSLIKQKFVEKIQYAVAVDDGKYISIPIYDPNLFIELQNLIKKNHGLLDIQNNQSNLKLPIDQFLNLIIALEADQNGKDLKEYQNKILKELKTKLKKSDKLREFFNTETIESFKDLKKVFIEKGFEKVLDILGDLIPGGQIVTPIIKPLLALFKNNEPELSA